MRLGELTVSLPLKSGRIHSIQAGKPTSYSFARLALDVAKTKSILLSWKIKPRSRVGIFAPNCYEYLVYDLALNDLDVISVAFTDDFSDEINDALFDAHHLCLLLISTRTKHSISERIGNTAYIDGLSKGISSIARDILPEDENPDKFCLAFSSGSAGGLKGLVISRRGIEETLPPIVDAIGLRPADTLLLFLPMSNFQQRTMCYSAICYDSDIIITDYSQLPLAIKLFNPTILIAPPMYYHMIHTRFANLGWDKGRKRLIAKAIDLIPLETLKRRVARRAFKEFYAQFGNSIRILVTGMAPTKRSACEFFSQMQLPISESYGLVETGSLTYRSPRCGKIGSVGKPLDGVHISFEDDGEIVIQRDQHLVLEYFQCAQGENERTFLKERGVATGDIGRLDKEGYLYLSGRKRELIITPGGFKIFPEILEDTLNNVTCVSQSIVFQKPSAQTLTTVIVLDPNCAGADRERVKRTVGDLTANKKYRIGEIIFADEPFSRENQLLRPNLKLDRRRIFARYAQIENAAS